MGKTVANHKGKECDARKWHWFTPTRPRGMKVIGFCNLSSVKVQCVFSLRKALTVEKMNGVVVMEGC